ncbi:hypothetical protein HZY88_09005 [Aerococcaceae bacterium DSM 111176]|nr:hypothetical protein [Aerococcaceae bacterium DSM 111176]
MMTEIINKREAEYRANISTAEDRGIERGIEKVIFQLYRSGLTVDTIAEHTDFSVNEVKDILEKDSL